ncbi:MAG: N-acetylneuraminate synthase family protein, partial [Kordiimonas sp.]
MTLQFDIDGRSIGEGCLPYIIAEISGNHMGNIETAFSLIEAANEAGADAVKFQTYEAHTITLDSDAPSFVVQENLWKGERLYDLYKKAQTPFAWHEALFKKAQDIGITAFSAPFDNTAVDLLESLNAPAYKIASCELVDIPLLKRVAQT